MESNAHSTQPADRPPIGAPGRPDPANPTGLTSSRNGLEALAAAVEELAAQDLTGLSDGVRAERVLALRRLVDRLEGHWLSELATVDARGAAGADKGQQAASTASWLRGRLRMGASTAASAVRTARALFRGPLATTAQAVTAGKVSPAHATVLAAGTHDLPGHVAAEAEPVLLEAARRLDPPRLQRVVSHLQQVADPDGAREQAERRHRQRGLWLAPTWEGMVAIEGPLEPEAGHTLLAALEPLAQPANAADARSGGQRRADALAELARRALEAGRLLQTGGVRPQLTVTVDLDSLLGRPGAVGGEAGWAGPLDPEGCRRLACDGALTRVVVTRRPPDAPSGSQDLTGRLRAAMTLLPPMLGGPPTQPLEVGRTTRVIQPAQRSALAVRDGGCSFPDCARPLAWCEAHHLRHWLHGGPTDLANLALLCRAHHRAVHEGGWRLQRGPDGRLTAMPPPRPPQPHRPHQRHPTAA
jgi:hypothetical protein